MEYIALATAAIALIEKLIPKIREMVTQGEVTPEEQAQLMARYNALKAAVEAGLTGPEWEQAPEE